VQNHAAFLLKLCLRNCLYLLINLGKQATHLIAAHTFSFVTDQIRPIKSLKII